MHWTKIAVGSEKTAEENLKDITDRLVLRQGNPFIFPEKTQVQSSKYKHFKKLQELERV